MPMLEAQTRPTFNIPMAGVYCFCEEHRPGWSEFWTGMKGDLDKIVDWAKKAEIEEPECWVNELHQFLFGLFSGDMRLMRKAAASSFSAYIAQVLENHINSPKNKFWYADMGTTQRGFITTLERATDIADAESAIHYINARLRTIGSKLYDEFLLAQAGHLDKVKSIASAMRKQAFEIEKEVCGEFDDFEEGDNIRHANLSGETLRVLDTVEDIVVAEDENGSELYIHDVWNLELV